MAQAMDMLALSMTDLGSICERRLARLVDPTLSYGLPRNLLAGKRGLNTGFATVQCSCRRWSWRTARSPCRAPSTASPARATRRTTSPTPPGARRKARTVVENVEMIVAGELLMAAQALSLVEPIAGEPPRVRSKAAFDAIRSVIPPALDGDRWYATEMNQAIGLVRSGAVLAAVEAKVGALE